MSGARVLVLDNFDSFTFTLVDYLRQLGAVVRVARNDSITVAEALDAEHDAVLLSPGPGRPENAGLALEVASACIERRRPLLGVCLGHQAIALACGASVDRVPPIHGKIEPIVHDGSGLFDQLPSPLSVTRYHSLAVRGICAPLIANAHSADGTVQAIRHAAAPVHGVQFHPESIGSEHGLKLLGAFVALALDHARCVA